MKKITTLHKWLWALALPLFLLACDKDDDGMQDAGENPLNIVEVAQDTDDLSSLVAALAKADEDETSDLIGTLSGEGPFTVFAPTNEAFGDLLGQLDGFDSLEDFDTEAKRDILRMILTYHVVAGVAAEAADLSDGQELGTVQGEKLRVNLESGVAIEDATDTPAIVVLPDVGASNGVVHVIDKVLLPQAVIDALNAGAEDDDPLGTLVDLVVETEALSVLEAAVIKAELVETLSGEGPFTVFAPTDDAFVALLEALGDQYNGLDDFDTEAELMLLKNILLYHVVPGEVREADLAAGTVPTALEGNDLTVIASGDTFVIGDATEVPAGITGTDFLASNGVAHTIDKVLLPQAAVDFLASLQLKTIVEIAVETDDLSLLVDALGQANAGLVETLSGEGPFTVFAPTNQAFVDLLAALGDDYNSLADFDTQAEIDLLVEILTYHVVAGTAAFSTDLSNGQSIATVQGESVGIDLSSGVQITDATDTPANVTTPDVEASNGVVHIVDKVLLPSSAVEFLASLQLKTIVEIAVETDDLSLLVDALVQANAGLVETLSGEGPFTVFAPTNQAFADLLHLLGDDYHSLADFDTQAEIDLLVEILTYHVVAGTAAFSTDLSNGQSIATVQGESVGIDLSSGVQITDATDTPANVTTPDVEASNGVVHIVDKVLLPSSAVEFLASLQLKTIVEIAVETDDLSLLVDALVQANAGLVETLSGEGPFTVFAPTNQAFADLLHLLGDDYHSLADFDTPEEIDLLVQVLTYHVVAGTAAFSTDLTDGQHIATVQGENVGVSLSHGVQITDATDTPANVVLPDVEASNGVVHVIDKVLLPQAVLDALSPPLPNIVELAQQTPELSSLVEALITADAGLVEVLSGEGPFTVFAPTNQAFAALLDALGDDYHSLADFDTYEEKQLLATVLTYHVVAGTAAFSTDLTDGQHIATVQGENIGIDIKNGNIHIEDATDTNASVVIPDVEASNGVVHVIDKILIPQEILDLLSAASH